ncbi:hypothetical protein CUMW_074850 [Citrus unshiu]|nr:hypothetical protein CUMW_074850 [Citrus unshiu]
MAMSSSSTTLSLDQFPTSEQPLLVHCNLCDNCSRGECSLHEFIQDCNGRCATAPISPVNMRGLLLPSANQFHLGHNFFSPSHNLRVGKRSQIHLANFLINQYKTQMISLPLECS